MIPKEIPTQTAQDASIEPKSERTTAVDLSALLLEHPELFEGEPSLEMAQRMASATRSAADARQVAIRVEGVPVAPAVIKIRE